MHKKTFYILVSMITCFSIPLRATEKLDINVPEFDGQYFGKKTYWYEDSSKILTIEDITSPGVRDLFTIGKKEVISTGFRNSVMWYRIHLVNPNTVPTTVYFHEGRRLFAEVSVYQDGQLISTFYPESDGFSRVASLQLKANTEHEIHIRMHSQVASYRSQFSFWKNEIHLASFLEKKNTKTLVVLCVFIMSLFYNFMFLVAYKSRLYGYYILYLLASSAGAIFTLSYVSNQFVVEYKMVYLALILNSIFTILFSRKFLNTNDDYPKYHLFLSGMISLFILLLIFHAIEVMVPGLNVLNTILNKATLSLTAVESFCIFFLSIFVTFQTRKIHNLLFCIAFSIFLGAACLQITSWLGYINYLNDYFMYTGIAIENILMLGALGYRIWETEKMRIQAYKRLSNANSELSKTTAELYTYINNVEELVEEKTRHISSILDHIDQGIFTILPDLTMEKTYSKYLKVVFDRADIALENPIESFFGNSSLSNDDLKRIETALIFTLNEPNYSFEINKHQFPNSMKKNGKSLTLTWRNIEKDDVTEKILVVIRDVTEMEKLEAETKIHGQKMARIEEMLAISSNVCHDFLNDSSVILQDCAEILNRSEKIDEIAIKKIFINYHTLKGNARRYNFKALVNVLHEAEETCSKEGDKTLLEFRDDFSRISTVLNNYKDISRNILNIHKSDQVGIDKEIVEQTIHLLKELPSENTELQGRVLKILKTSSLKPVRELIETAFENVDSLASQLGKETPLLDLNCDKVGFNQNSASVVSNILTHLIRNSIDHGIESADLRESKGKQAYATIAIKVRVEGDCLRIYYKDNGQGLDLPKIKAKGMDMNLIDANEDDPVRIANLIFEHGFSTSKEVTEISGRGVGMDAVRSFADKSGCLFQLKLIKSNLCSSDYAPFEFILSLDESMFESLD